MRLRRQPILKLFKGTSPREVPFLLPHEPFTVKIRAIFVQTQRSLRNAFGAARHNAIFDRVNGDI
jgi:hypothetical protein